LPIMGGIAAVIGVGALAWNVWESSQKQAAESNNQLTASMREMPDLLKRISDAAKAGALSPEQQQAMLVQLGAVKGTFSAPSFNSPQQQNFGSNAQLPQGYHISTGQFGIPDAIDIQKVNDELVQTGDLLKTITDGKTSYVENPAIQAVQAQKDLVEKMNVERLDGFDKERQSAEETYQKEIQRLQQIAQLENFIKDPTQRASALTGNAAAQTEAGQVRDNTISGIDDKEQAKADADARAAAAKDASEQIKATETSLTLFEAQQGAVRTDTVEAAYQTRVALAQKLLDIGEIDEEQYSQMVEQAQAKEIAGAERVAAAKQKALDEVSRAQTAWAELQSKVATEGQTGQARQLAQIDAAAQKLADDIKRIGTAAGMTDAQIAQLTADSVAGFQKQRDAVDTFRGKLGEAKTQTEMLQDVGVQAANSFASGVADAMVSFATGTKTAKQAFLEFAKSFLEEIAKMIIEQEILNAIKAMSWLGSGGMTTADAAGGVHFAADGIQSVSSPTYFPKFNVLAGEAGMEMLTVLARPTLRSVGGMDAVVGNAGSKRLAITNAGDLENNGRGGAGGTIHIQIDHTPETQATIIQNSIKGAVSEVTHQLKRNTPLSASVKALTQ